jgi:glycosyltransferase involved in cell wall biosynthesis
MNRARPSVSVLIPTYNYARYLPETIESVLKQSYTDFELLISDDGSNDGSADIIRSYAARDDRIRFVVQTPNLGMVNNWNWCLQEASGKYVKYVFGDDFLTRSDSLARLVDMMESEPGISLASSARTLVDEHSQPIGMFDHFPDVGVFDGREAISWSIRTNCNVFGEPSVVLFRKSAAQRAFDTSYRQVVDWEFWIHLLEHGNFAYTKEPLTAFRQHSLQQTEVNRRATGEATEHPRLLLQYQHYFVFRSKYRQETFQRLHGIRKRRIREPTEVVLADIFKHALGASFYLYLLRYKLVRPLFNVRRTWHKYVTRVPFPDETSQRRLLRAKPLSSGSTFDLRS